MKKYYYLTWRKVIIKRSPKMENIILARTVEETKMNCFRKKKEKTDEQEHNLCRKIWMYLAVYIYSMQVHFLIMSCPVPFTLCAGWQYFRVSILVLIYIVSVCPFLHGYGHTDVCLDQACFYWFLAANIYGFLPLQYL